MTFFLGSVTNGFDGISYLDKRYIAWVGTSHGLLSTPNSSTPAGLLAPKYSDNFGLTVTQALPRGSSALGFQTLPLLCRFLADSYSLE